MTTLTDRYIWGVLRGVPEAQRKDLEPEIRALVADAVDAQAAGGAAPEAAERAALVELGDPDALAARYTDTHRYLIGPQAYPEWRRTVGIVTPIVVPITGIASGAAQYVFAGETLAQSIVAGVGTALIVAVQVVFWITVAFAILERQGQSPRGEPWTPDALPHVPTRASVGLAEVALSLVALGLAIIALVWQQVAQPITIEGESYPLFDPTLWSFWLPWFLAILGLEIVFTLVRWRRGGWTMPLAVVNLGLDVAFAVPAVYLLQNDLLLDPGLVAAIDAQTGGAWLGPTMAIGAVVAVVVAAWDSFDGFRQAARNARLATGS